MSIELNAKDLMHRIKAKFYPATLPKAKKPYNLRVESQTELDVLGIASKAEAYNFTTSPKTIEEGLSVGMQLIKYLAADGYHIKTPIFNLSVRVPGEYDGTETHLPAGHHPKGRLNLSAEARHYFSEHVTIEINGKEDNAGYISEVIDSYDGTVDETLHIGFPFEIYGAGLKIAADAEHAGQEGLFLINAANPTLAVRIDPRLITVNEPHLIKATVNLNMGLANPGDAASVYLEIRTQASARSHSTLLTDIRTVRSDFTLTLTDEDADNQPNETAPDATPETT
jgi:hypothetical protein